MTATGPRPDIEAIVHVTREIFGANRPLTVEPVERGVSTFVYRVQRGNETFYLRVLPEIGDSFAPEAAVHQLLLDRGARVPGILHVDPCHHDLGLSVMVTTALRGQPLDLCGSELDIPSILQAAGRDLAMINAVPVDGFGWIRRDRDIGSRLAGELPTGRAFADEMLGESWGTVRMILEPGEIGRFARVLRERDAWLDSDCAQLAHGDVDTSHIFVDSGLYSGLIDFGEIRGTDRWDDLGYVQLWDADRRVGPLLPHLLAGYQSVAPLPPNAAQRIPFAGLLIGLRMLARDRLKGRPGANSARALRRAVDALASVS